MGKIFDRLCGAYLQFYNRSRRLDFINRYSDDIDKTRDALVNALGDTEFFHGTGAYHYDFVGTKYEGTPNGVRYSLESLLTDGLMPQRDFFNEHFETGAESTTSLSRNHVYARCYADLFQTEGETLAYCYGPPQFWGYLVAARMILHEMSREARHQRRIWLEERRKNNDYLKKREQLKEYSSLMFKGWTRSFRKDGKYEGKNFLLALGAKSDIQNNFGIIIGVKKGAVHGLPIKYRGVALYEDRTNRRIFPEEYSHIQVPYGRVEFSRHEMNRLGIDIPIFPIEFAELINHQSGFIKASRIYK